MAGTSLHMQVNGTRVPWMRHALRQWLLHAMNDACFALDASSVVGSCTSQWDLPVNCDTATVVLNQGDAARDDLEKDLNQ